MRFPFDTIEHQAFLEFDATESAKQMVDYFTSMPAMMNGRQVFVQYSNHGELRTDPTNRSNQQAHVALAQATDLYETAQKGGQNCVLRISIMNVLFPVTIDVLYQVRPILTEAYDELSSCRSSANLVRY